MTHHPPLVGIIGGYGPSTSALFCRHLVAHALRLRSDRAPSFIMDSIPISFADAGLCIGGDIPATRRLVEDANHGIRRLASLGVKTIALPCNSVHVLFSEFATAPGVDILHIADPLVTRLRADGYRRVGFLASGMTAREDIYFSRMRAAGIEYVLPSGERQHALNAEITSFVESGKAGASARTLLGGVFQELQRQNIDAFVLACTDLSGILSRLALRPPIPLEDSMEALAEECARRSVA